MTEVMIPLEMPDIQITIPEEYQETSTDRNEKVYIKNDASIIVNSDTFTENYKTLDEYISFAEKHLSSIPMILSYLTVRKETTAKLSSIFTACTLKKVLFQSIV